MGEKTGWEDMGAKVFEYDEQGNKVYLEKEYTNPPNSYRKTVVYRRREDKSFYGHMHPHKIKLVKIIGG